MCNVEGKGEGGEWKEQSQGESPDWGLRHEFEPRLGDFPTLVTLGRSLTLVAAQLLH